VGEFDPVKRWVDKVEKAVDTAAQRRIVKAMGVAGKKAADDAARASLGGDRKMRNLKGSGLSAEFDEGSAGDGAVGFRGPWRLAEEGRRRAGMIRPRRRRAVLTPRGPRAWSRYGRSRGLKTYTHAVDRARTTVGKAGHDQLVDEISRVL
jgi:hypothetical protein